MDRALIGESTIASQFMIGAIRATPGNAMRWVVSGIPARAGEYAAARSIPKHSANIAAALSDPAVGTVYISFTNEKHLPQAMAANMVRAAEAAGVVFAPNHHLRCSGSHTAVRDRIGRGRIGRVRSLRIFHAVHLPETLQVWHINSADAGGGVVPGITVQDADVARSLPAEDPMSVVAGEAVVPCTGARVTVDYGAAA